MAVEKYIAVASLGLFIMFVAEIITMYNFMQESTETGSLILEPDPKFLQFISIGVSPAIIMAVVSFIMSKRYGSKPIGRMIIAGGIILFGGMMYAHFMTDGFDPVHKSEFFPIITPLFMIVSIPIIILGVRLLKIKKRKAKKDYF